MCYHELSGASVELTTTHCALPDALHPFCYIQMSELNVA